MNIKKDNLYNALKSWELKLKDYTLPLWEQLPTIDLYMEQIVTLVGQYLGIYNEVASDKLITPSMINNYVKLKIIPAPVKKKYSRVHIAYLVLVCTLKQTLDMATIQKFMPVDLTEERVMEMYNSFVINQNKAFGYVTEKVYEVSKPIIEMEGDNQSRMNDFVMQIAASANTFKILAEKIAEIAE